MRLLGLDWRISLAIAVILSLAFGAVVRSLAVYGSATSASEISQVREHCEAEEKAHPGKRPKECKGFFELTFEDPIAIFTAVLTVATVFLFVANCGLWYAALRQGEDTQRAIVAAQDSAAAAKTQAEVALGTLRLAQSDQRAWLIARTESQNAREWLNETVGFEWKFYFANVGSRTAIIHKVEAFASIADELPPIDADSEGAPLPRHVADRFYPCPRRFDFDIQTEVIESLGKSEFFIARGDRNGAGWPNLPPEILEERQRLRLRVSAPDTYPGKVWFWLVGFVVYTDATSDEPRVTQFGLRFGLPFPKIKPIEEEGYNYRT